MKRDHERKFPHRFDSSSIVSHKIVTFLILQTPTASSFYFFFKMSGMSTVIYCTKSYIKSAVLLIDRVDREELFFFQ